MSALTDGAPLPDPANSRWHKVISPKGQHELTIVFLSERIMGYWTHWNGVPTPCRKTSGCPGCKAGLGQRWTGYAACYSITHKAECVVALSEGAVRQLAATIQQHGSLRGFNVSLKRKLPRANAPVHVTVNRREPLDRCPAAFSVEDSLNRLWGIAEAKQRDNASRTHQLRDDDSPDVVPMPYRPRPHDPASNYIPH